MRHERRRQGEDALRKENDRMKREDMPCWYFTFGCAHPLGNHVQRVFASNSEEARKTMLGFYGTKWASQYGPYEITGSASADGYGSVVIRGFRYRLIPKDLYEGDTL